MELGRHAQERGCVMSGGYELGDKLYLLSGEEVVFQEYDVGAFDSWPIVEMANGDIVSVDPVSVGG